MVYDFGISAMQKGLRSPHTGYYREFIYIILLNATEVLICISMTTG